MIGCARNATLCRRPDAAKREDQPVIKRTLLPILTAVVVITAGFAASAAEEPDKVVARIDGAPITEADIARAQAEIGQHLAATPAQDRRRLLIDYVINSKLMAKAAEDAGLDQTQVFKDQIAYLRQQALKDLFLERKVRDAITEAEAKKLYDEQVTKIEPEMEVRARHVLVPTEEAAKDVAKRIADGEDFAKVASSVSQDPGSAPKGGDIGYFTKDQMVAPFAEAAFALEPGKVSEPVKTQFGWHIIKVEDKRKQPLPSFEALKDRLLSLLASQKTGETLRALRKDAKIEMMEPEANANSAAPAQEAPKPGETKPQDAKP